MPPPTYVISDPIRSQLAFNMAKICLPHRRLHQPFNLMNSGHPCIFFQDARTYGLSCQNQSLSITFLFENIILPPFIKQCPHFSGSKQALIEILCILNKLAHLIWLQYCNPPKVAARIFTEQGRS